jgi:hypothetical protein
MSLPRLAATFGLLLLLSACGAGSSDTDNPISTSQRARQGAASASPVRVFSGMLADYTLSKDGSNWTISGNGQQQTVPANARLRFTDTSLALDLDGNAGKAYRLYQAAFNRTPDTAGLSYWINVLDSGASLDAVAASFASSAEFQTVFGTAPVDVNLIGQLYVNVLHRAGEAAGVDFWTQAMRSGATAAQLLQSFSESGENRSGVQAAIQNGIPYTEAGISYPRRLRYSAETADYTLGSAITANRPAASGLSGTPVFSIAPALPDGLRLDASTGAISGTPTALTPAAVYRVTARSGDQQASGTVTLSVHAPSPILVTQCGDISSAGNYLVRNDLIGQGDAACLNLHGAYNVHLDCAGHLIAGKQPLSLASLRNFSVNNCRFQMSDPNTSAMAFFSSDTGTMAGNSFSKVDGGYAPVLMVQHINQLVFDHNTVSGSLQLSQSSNAIVSNNQFTAWAAKKSSAALISTSGGSNNSIVQNVLDGSWDRLSFYDTDVNGARAGIAIDNEIGLLVQGNTISNVYWCGINWDSTLAMATISGNHIRYASIYGLGAAQAQNTIGVTFANNVVEESGSMFQFTRNLGMSSSNVLAIDQLGVTRAVIFKNNVFDGNVLRNEDAGTNRNGLAGMLRLFDYLDFFPNGYVPAGFTMPQRSDFQMQNNVFKNNDFSQQIAGPDFGWSTPIDGLVIDGGGNHCRTPLWPTTPYPLACLP